MVFFYTIIVVAFFVFLLNLGIYKEDNPEEKSNFKAIINALYDTRYFLHPYMFIPFMLFFGGPALCIVVILCKIFMTNEDFNITFKS